ncbi:NADH dehydrogenase [ubiquinone] 1 alpha subcomplex subunit 9, mitochondrial-like [Halichondria panicea]|uniref:NADH dehydrogenase [ubiquinone] 1 alpha subcomplex subunit 9, mitochondrial-like n=1 Tax=Halichondria panicea TaxID=6063 RepID=UPI00312B7EDA
MVSTRLLLQLAPVLRLPQATRSITSLAKRGKGGRSSFSGVVATVFGGPGFLGRYVVNRLGRVGSQVVVPYRGDEHDYRYLKPMGDLGQIVFVKYDLRDPESVYKAVKHSNVVINLVGRDYETRNFSFTDVNVNGARTIAEACQAAGVKRLIHFSALNATSDSPSQFLQTKAQGEELVREVFPTATVVRPADTYGHEDRFLHYYASLRVFPFGVIPVMSGADQTTKRPVYVGDIAHAVGSIISDSATAGKTYELAGATEYPLPELIQYIYRVMYRQCTVTPLPRALYRFVSSLMELNPFVPYMTRDIATRLHLSNTPTPGLPGLEDLGVTPTHLEDVAINFIRRYRNFMDFDHPIEETHPNRPS